MDKLQTLKNELVNTLTDEAARAGKWVWNYQFIESDSKQHAIWSEYRLQVMRNRRMVADWTIDDFRVAVNRNLYNVQAYLFGQN